MMQLCMLLLLNFAGPRQSLRLMFTSCTLRSDTLLKQKESKVHLYMDSKLREMLPFVNRYAEVFDICAVNFEKSVTFFPDAKRSVAVATQIMGTGKTILGRHLVEVLNRPREPSEVEIEVTRILKYSQVLSKLTLDRIDNIISKAIQRPENETIVVRALKEYLIFRNNDEYLANQIVDEMKVAETIKINIRALDTSVLRLENAIAKSIAEHFHLSTYKSTLPQLCKSIIQHQLNNRPLFIVFDEIGELGDDRFSMWTVRNAVAPQNDAEMLFHGMRALSRIVQLILNGQQRFVYCTGRSAVVSLQSLSGQSSPLYPFPILLHPLSKDDVREMFKRYSSHQHIINLNVIATDPEIIDYLSEKLVELSGGMGRVIESALSLLSDVHLSSKEGVDEALQTVSTILPSYLFSYDNSQESAILESTLLERTGQLLLSGGTFYVNEQIKISGREIPFRDALNMLGFTYAPAVQGLDSDLFSDSQMRVVAGRWHVERLPESVKSSGRAADILLATKLASVAGTGRGIPFESICYNSLQKKCESFQGTFGEMLPHLMDTPVGSMNVRPLCVVNLPKVTEKSKLMTDSEKAEAMTCRTKWILSRKTIRRQDLSWLLSEWLETNSIGVSAERSGPQNWYMKVSGCIVGFTNEMRSGSSNLLTPSRLQIELGKIPFISDMPYAIVIYVTSLGPKLSKQIGNKPVVRLSYNESDHNYTYLVNSHHIDGLPSLVGEKVAKNLYNYAP